MVAMVAMGTAALTSTQEIHELHMGATISVAAEVLVIVGHGINLEREFVAGGSGTKCRDSAVWSFSP